MLQLMKQGKLKQKPADVMAWDDLEALPPRFPSPHPTTACAAPSSRRSRDCFEAYGSVRWGRAWAVRACVRSVLPPPAAHRQVDTSHVVGEGGFGCVFKGRWNSVTVAVKQLVEATLDERDMRKGARTIPHKCAVTRGGPDHVPRVAAQCTGRRTSWAACPRTPTWCAACSRRARGLEAPAVERSHCPRLAHLGALLRRRSRAPARGDRDGVLRGAEPQGRRTRGEQPDAAAG